MYGRCWDFTCSKKQQCWATPCKNTRRKWKKPPPTKGTKAPLPHSLWKASVGAGPHLTFQCVYLCSMLSWDRTPGFIPSFLHMVISPEIGVQGSLWSPSYFKTPQPLILDLSSACLLPRMVQAIAPAAAERWPGALKALMAAASDSGLSLLQRLAVQDL